MLVRASSLNLVEAELLGLSKAPIRELRKRYHEVFDRLPPPAFGPDLLRRTIAYHVQERMYGGLSASDRRELAANIRLTRRGSSKKAAVSRRIKTGSVLIREWNGKTHKVTITIDGFLYHNQKNATLSAIAREITGTRWNGPRFFGLRSHARDVAKLETTGLSAK